MSWTDEDLMAYADGQLDALRRAALDSMLTQDAALRERVAHLRAQRERVAAAFAPVLDEPMPERLTQLLASPPAAVVDIAAARAAREPRHVTSPSARSRPGSWAHWGGMAASLVAGVLLGTQLQRGEGPPDAVLALNAGQAVATGAVAQALNTQLASDAAAQATVAVQLTFIDKTGQVCRTFSTGRMAGLVCRDDGDRWAVQQVATMEQAAAGAMRQAASSLPRAVLDAVDRQIAGDAFDAAAERQARERGWRR